MYYLSLTDEDLGKESRQRGEGDEGTSVEPEDEGDGGEEEGMEEELEEGEDLEEGEEMEEDEDEDAVGESGGEGKHSRSGSFADRSESRAYGSITHKCEVRGDHFETAAMEGYVAVLQCLNLTFVCLVLRAYETHSGMMIPVFGCPCPRTVGRSSLTRGTLRGTSASTRGRSPSPAGTVTRPSPTPPPARLTRRRTGQHWGGASLHFILFLSCSTVVPIPVSGDLLFSFQP